MNPPTARPLAVCLLVVAAGLAGCAAPDDPGTRACLTPDEHAAIFPAAAGSVNVSTPPDRVVTIGVEGTFEGVEASLEVSLDPMNRTAWIRGTVGGSPIDARAVGEHWSIDDQVEGTVGYGRDLDPDGAAANLALRYQVGGRTAPEIGPDFVLDLSADDYDATCEERDGAEIVRFVHEDDGRRDVLVAERQPPHRLLSDRVVDESEDHDLERTYRYEASSAPVDEGLPRTPFTVRVEMLEPVRRDDNGTLHYTAQVIRWTQWAPFDSTDVVTRDRDGVRDRVPLSEGRIELDGGTLVYEDRDGNGMINPGDVYSWDLDRGVQGLFHDRWSGEPVEECRPPGC